MTTSASERIERVGPPKVGVSSDGRRVVSILLRAAPSTMWRQFFRYARARPPACYPDLVWFQGEALAFLCAEQDVETWVRCVDWWIEDANRRCAEYRSSPQQRGGAYEPEELSDGGALEGA